MKFYRRLLWTLAGVLCLIAPASGKNTPGMQSKPPQDGRSVETKQGFMIPYEQTIPGTDVTFEMVPVPAGTFLLGSPPDEPHRESDEGPQVKVDVSAFWIGKCEVTWAEYRAYMDTYDAFKRLGSLRGDSKKLRDLAATRKYLESESVEVDGVTSPTPLYDPSFTYYPGEDPEQPAVTMTQFAAKQYTKWLSGITGEQYRLPTEAEWEFAARAGSNAAFCFGNDVSELSHYAWYEENSDDETHPVGKKKPNAWGLFDMHGNAAEWVLDEYRKEHYAKLDQNGVTSSSAVAWPEKLFPRVIRGGCWFDGSAPCRSAARHQSDDPNWNLSDPNIPKSPWWFTEDPSTGVGLRIVRPLDPMDEATCKKVWDADIEWIEQDIADRLDEGRGTIRGADKRLPAAISELEAAGLID